MEIVPYNKKFQSYRPKKILLISNINTGPSKHNIQSRKDMLYDILDQSRINCIINVASFNSINHMNELTLIHYDCIIYDLLDGGCEINNPTSEIENYLKNGGNILVTHDHLGYGLCPLLGLQFADHPIRIHKEAINVSSKHEIWNSYYSLNTMNKLIINVCDTHGNFIISNKETIQLMHSNDSNNDLYLSVRHLGKGKAVYWNAGHTPIITPDEKRLFLNIMTWILDLNLNES